MRAQHVFSGHVPLPRGESEFTKTLLSLSAALAACYSLEMRAAWTSFLVSVKLQEKKLGEEVALLVLAGVG